MHRLSDQNWSSDGVEGLAESCSVFAQRIAHPFGFVLLCRAVLQHGRLAAKNIRNPVPAMRAPGKWPPISEHGGLRFGRFGNYLGCPASSWTPPPEWKVFFELGWEGGGCGHCTLHPIPSVSAVQIVHRTHYHPNANGSIIPGSEQPSHCEHPPPPFRPSSCSPSDVNIVFSHILVRLRFRASCITGVAVPDLHQLDAYA
jgi:hypothetical protein